MCNNGFGGGGCCWIIIIILLLICCCGCGGGYGNYVIIQHDGTYSTVYGHMQSLAVSEGDYVSAGQTIGYVGTTGFSTGYHLHFEIRVNGSRVDPMNYL